MLCLKKKNDSLMLQAMSSLPLISVHIVIFWALLLTKGAICLETVISTNRQSPPPKKTSFASDLSFPF